ncbi:hypothetical protein BO86DRAFT_376405 [Aspergillus japonicus CBS 114.51]|uniref:Uncharacterized protein n=1 Tax=Aspergillus japonicus CBS 114.51 TaxID=1448312 RepID=A0A8T8XAZ7_ASPJA|nr:hypothetical protein BO86DRAFT_376405 [Aspergillus japonicus CBS 114.51]RAH85397.1 hypothetical protein BO86DRAFT_376405 [Aspergillus japonicus CBS 114.51]
MFYSTGVVAMSLSPAFNLHIRADGCAAFKPRTREDSILLLALYRCTCLDLDAPQRTDSSRSSPSSGPVRSHLPALPMATLASSLPRRPIGVYEHWEDPGLILPSRGVPDSVVMAADRGSSGACGRPFRAAHFTPGHARPGSARSFPVRWCIQQRSRPLHCRCYWAVAGWVSCDAWRSINPPPRLPSSLYNPPTMRLPAGEGCPSPRAIPSRAALFLSSFGVKHIAQSWRGIYLPIVSDFQHALVFGDATLMCLTEDASSFPVFMQYAVSNFSCYASSTRSMYSTESSSCDGKKTKIKRKDGKALQSQEPKPQNYILCILRQMHQQHEPEDDQVPSAPHPTPSFTSHNYE